MLPCPRQTAEAREQRFHVGMVLTSTGQREPNKPLPNALYLVALLFPPAAVGKYVGGLEAFVNFVLWVLVLTAPIAIIHAVCVVASAEADERTIDIVVAAYRLERSIRKLHGRDTCEAK